MRCLCPIANGSSKSEALISDVEAFKVGDILAVDDEIDQVKHTRCHSELLSLIPDRPAEFR